MEYYSHLPQLSNGQLDLSKVQHAQLMKYKPNRGKGYTAWNSCITEVIIYNKPTKPLLDSGAFSSCVGKSFLKTFVRNFEDRLLPIDGIKFNSASNPMKALGIFETNVKESEISIYLTYKQENALSSLLYHHKGASASDKEPLGEIIGHGFDIILNIDRPYPPLLRRPAYPESPKSREALETCIKELLALGVIRKVGHNEEVEINKPVIVAWHNGKSRMVGELRALNTYTVPDRYPIPKIQIALTQISQAVYITTMDALKGLHPDLVT
ncbi:hypothetical protein O181_103729 [Austropuccinia psidii MF-1]|uniref:Reverse transcriptase/retrotransposon-derived protein RNase H-like domain-containing protein n=1 Tax=Austropuccinia psidii MF-1 TaxID=1389203 RepID=A0A9Q3JL15_9BASI|nr:hypothetical protein [Austropuccinia psidii MF-1]